MPDNEGRTALMWAAQRGNYKVLEVMLQKEVDIHAFDNLGGTGTKFCVLGQSVKISNNTRKKSHLNNNLQAL